MKIAFFDTHHFEKPIFERVNADFGHSITFFEPRLTTETAKLAAGFNAVCSFVNDRLDAKTLTALAQGGVGLIALRSAGFNHVDLKAAESLGLRVVRVPAYSPYAVAEHAACLVLALNRKVHRASHRVRDLNFSLDGLVGFDLHGKTAAVLGTGKIGAAFARIMAGFGCRVLCYDTHPNQELMDSCKVEYLPLPEIFPQADIISLHVPLTPETRHLIGRSAIESMKRGVMIINTGRGALIDTPELLTGLKSGQIGYAGLDVYEEEEGVFFRDLSDRILQDDVLARLLTFPNVLITSHQGFLTQEALTNIAETTLENVTAFEKGTILENEVCARMITAGTTSVACDIRTPMPHKV